MQLLYVYLKFTNSDTHENTPFYKFVKFHRACVHVYYDSALFYLSLILLYRFFLNWFQFPCINEQKKAKKKKYENSGFVICDSIKVLKTVSYLSDIVTQPEFTIVVTLIKWSLFSVENMWTIIFSSEQCHFLDTGSRWKKQILREIINQPTLGDGIELM